MQEEWQQERVVKQLLQRHASHILRQCMLTWQNSAILRKLEGRVAGQLSKRIAMSTTRSNLEYWQKTVRASRFMQHMYMVRASFMFDVLTAHVIGAADCPLPNRDVHSYTEVAVACTTQSRSFQQWSLGIVQKERARTVMRHALAFMRQTALARTFLPWRLFVTAMAERHMVFVRKQRAVRNAIRWGDTMRRRRNRRLLVRAFEAWRLQTATFVAVRSLMQRHGQHTLARAWSAWQAWHDEMQHVRDRMYLAAQRWSERSRHKVLAAWCCVAKLMQQHMCERVAAFRLRVHTRITTACLTQWKEVAAHFKFCRKRLKVSRHSDCMAVL
jgi:hypothetical protein